jgi:hypothetical protein
VLDDSHENLSTYKKRSDARRQGHLTIRGDERRPLAGGLLLQAELLRKRVVAARVFFLGLAKMRAAIGNHLEKTAAGMEILGVLLEMARQLVDALRKKRNLDFRRPGVLLVSARILDNGRLFLRSKHDSSTIPRLDYLCKGCPV